MNPMTDHATLTHPGADRIQLSPAELPLCWYNAAADLPSPLAPPISPITGKPVRPAELLSLFPPALLEQEMGSARFVEIPAPVRELLGLWRPTELIRARRLERALDTPARIYFKYEGSSPAGSHKLNTAIPQAFYNQRHGVRRLATETGAGQWGSSLAIAASFFEMECRVFMVRVSHDQKPYRRTFMQLYGAEVIPSPSPFTSAGRAILDQDPDCPGSLGIAISEAVEEAVGRQDTNYALGSVLNHVLLHQTVIGLEAKKQLQKIGEEPDFVYACHGGGSNFGGLALPFLPDILEGKPIQVVAVEPAGCPTLTCGRFAYDFGDTGKLTPIVQMYTLGHDFIPPSAHAGGLRYHGASPLVSALVHQGLFRAEAVGQVEVFEAARLFATTEGLIPAPESAHAIAGAVRKAVQLREEGRSGSILLGVSGHGLLDLGAFEDFLAGRIVEHEHSDGSPERALGNLPVVNS